MIELEVRKGVFDNFKAGQLLDFEHVDGLGRNLKLTMRIAELVRRHKDRPWSPIYIIVLEEETEPPEVKPWS